MPRHEVVIIPRFAEAEAPVEVGKNPPATEPTSQQKSKKDSDDLVSGAVTVMVARKIGMGAINRIGALSGNYVVADQIRNAQNIATYAAALVVNPIGGAIYMGLDVGTKAFDYTLMMDKANKETQMYRDMMGVATSQGSRKGGRKL